jgi:hypothetical protein
MNPISWQRWASTFAILILLSLLADFFFLHILFDPSHHVNMAPKHAGAPKAVVDTVAASDLSTAGTPNAGPVAPNKAETPAPTEQDNFLKTLQNCRSEVSAPGVATPEALMTYLVQSIGKKDELVEIENFIFNLPDGSERRVHLIPADNTNSKTKRELRYFKVDEEGYPERLALTEEQKQMPVEQLAQQLVAEGQMQKHQVKSSIHLRDGSFLSLETHNDKIYEFQWRPSDSQKTLSCRHLNCICQ